MAEPIDIPLKEVSSKEIAAIGHDEPTSTLAIRFKRSGAIYHYANFTRSDYVRFATAASIGTHFFAHIKNEPVKYPYIKVSKDEPKPRGDDSADPQLAL